jgi:tetratricopeptide (TPR) repeat protein
VQACPPSAGYRLRKFLRRNKGPVLAASVVLLALVAGMIGTTLGLLRAERARQVAERKEHEAKEQAAIAQAMSDFLQRDLLGQADVANRPLVSGVPQEERNPNVTVRELLDRAARQIEGKFADQGPIEAAIRATIGDAYRALGEYAKAERHLKRALELRTARFGTNHFGTLWSKNLLALLYLDQRNYDQAEPLLREAVEGLTAQVRADDPHLLASKQNLAEVYCHQRNYDQAEPLYREVIENQTTRLGAHHPDTLSTKNNLALLYLDQGKYDRAEPLFQEVLESATTQLGGDHPYTLLTKNNLATLYRSQGNYAQTKVLGQEVLQGMITKRGAEHPWALMAKFNLARVYDDEGRYDEAEPLYREAAEGALKQFGLINLHTHEYVVGLNHCYLKMGQPAKGEPLLRELADLAKQQAGADSLPYARLLANLGWNLVRQKKGAEAEAVLRASVAIRQLKEPETWTTFATQSLLGEALLFQKNYADAEPLLLQGYEGLNQRAAKIPKDFELNSHLIEAIERLVRLYQDSEQPEKAAAWRHTLQVEKKSENKAGP